MPTASPPGELLPFIGTRFETLTSLLKRQIPGRPGSFRPTSVLHGGNAAPRGCRSASHVYTSRNICPNIPPGHGWRLGHGSVAPGGSVQALDSARGGAPGAAYEVQSSTALRNSPERAVGRACLVSCPFHIASTRASTRAANERWPAPKRARVLDMPLEVPRRPLGGPP